MTLRYLEIFGLGEDAEHAGRRGQTVHITSGGLQRAPGFQEAELGFRCSIAWAGAAGSMTRGGCSKNGWPRCITSSRNVLALVASDELAGKIRIGASTTLSDLCCRKSCTISRCGTIRSKSNVSRNTADIVRHGTRPA